MVGWPVPSEVCTQVMKQTNVQLSGAPPGMCSGSALAIFSSISQVSALSKQDWGKTVFRLVM